MPRLSRAESQARTRTALLEATRATLVETGVGAASVDGIAERAGYSKGAVYSNFQSRDSILLALLEQQFGAELASLAGLLSQDIPLEDLLERVRALYAAMHKDPAIVILSVEFQLLAIRNADVRRVYTSLWARHRAALAEILVTAAARLGLSLRSPATEVIDILAALTRGLVMQSAVGMPKGAITVQDAIIRFLRSELSASS